MTSAVMEVDPRLVGRQEPHHLSEFEGSDVRGEKAAILGGRIGLHLFPWQHDSIRAMLRIDENGRWTHPDCCLIVPRQNGKSEILLLRCLYGLFVRGERIVFTTQRWKTAEELSQRFNAMIDARPSLKAKLAKKPTGSNGQAETVLKSGAKIQFTTRSNDAGRGFTRVDLVIFDEAYNLTNGQEDALDWAQMASDNAQTIYTSSAVNASEHPNGQVLASVRRRGLNQGDGLYFAEFMAPDEMQWDSLETARYANPSYGVIQTDEKIRAKIRKCTTAAKRRSYGVEALGRGDWPIDENDVEPEFDENEWEDLKDLAPELIGSIALGLDRSYGDKVWALTAAQHTAEGRIHIELGFFGEASNSAMVAMIALVVHAWDPVVLMIDKRSPANVLEPLLIAEGIAPQMTTTPLMATACLGIEDDFDDKALSHTGQKALTDSVLGAAKRFLPMGDFAWDRTAGTVISPLVSGTLARQGLVMFAIEDTGPGELAEIGKPADDNDQFWGADNSFDAMTAAF